MREVGRSGKWDRAIERFYKWKNAEALQEAWQQWALKKTKPSASQDS